MEPNTLAIVIGGFILTHFASVIGAIAWGVKHIVNYVVLTKEFNDLKKDFEEFKKNDFENLKIDVDRAHDKIRGKNANMEKN